MEIWKKVVSGLRGEIPDLFRDMGGRSANSLRSLQAAWTYSQDEVSENDVTVDIENEIAAALHQEIKNELMLSLFNQARDSATPYSHFEKISISRGDQQFFSSAIKDATGLTGEKSQILVSPTALTIIQSTDDFSRYEGPITNFGVVGEIDGHLVRVNQYWSDDQPVIIAPSNWFFYSAGDITTAWKIDNNVRLASDVKFEIESGLKKITFDPAGLSFY